MGYRLDSRAKIPTLGLILVVLSMPLVILNWPVSVLLLFAGIAVMAAPAIRLRRPSIDSRLSGVKSRERPSKASMMDSCVSCGKPVPKGVAYCSECMAKQSREF